MWRPRQLAPTLLPPPEKLRDQSITQKRSAWRVWLQRSSRLASFGRVGLERVLVSHNAHKLLLIHLAIAIQVRFRDHLLQLLVSHILAKLARYPLKIAESDLPGLVVVKELEYTPNLLRRVTVAHLPCHHLHELLKVNGPRTVKIDIGDHLAHFLLFRVKAKRPQCHLQLLCVDCARAICVKKIKGLSQLLHLPLWDARPRDNLLRCSSLPRAGRTLIG
mmetsp:Transcript_53114/g.113540  ORF Transcript_53114/g.113540 Transcript_53114/m.113540 type:complete len:219 (-) Transcript_53114:93-749(-)